MYLIFIGNVYISQYIYNNHDTFCLKLTFSFLLKSNKHKNINNPFLQ